MPAILPIPSALRKRSIVTRLDHGWILIAAFVAVHTLTISAGGSNAKTGSFVLLIAAPLIAAASCLWHIKRYGTAQGWGEMSLALLLWAGGMTANMAVDLIMVTPDSLPDISMLLYILYGVPLIFAVSSPAEEKWYIRVVDGTLAVVLGALFWVHTFSFASGTTATEQGYLAIRSLFDVENGFIAVFALVRWRACADLQRRRFFAILAAFALIYAAVAFYTNHFATDVDFGTFADLVIPLPFLWLAVVALQKLGRQQPLARPPSRRFSLAVRAGSPLMLPATLLVVSYTLLSTTTGIAATGFVMATLGYGLRNVLAQMRGIAEQDRLGKLSCLDALTRLPNRRQFNATLQSEWARARRSGSAIAVLLIDIDHFKQLNDSFGHQVGDQRLRDVAQELSACLTRSSDFVGRYGGEEFVAILPNATQASAAALAEIMCKAVAARSLPATTPRGIVTVSIGVAWTAAADAAGPEQIVSMADAALYRAKEHGRDRAELASPGMATSAQNRAASVSDIGSNGT